MKIKIDIDVKPQEVRTLIGLPDVEGLQEDVVNYVRGKLASGADALEAVGLLKQFIPESVSAVSNLQKSILKSLGRFAGGEENPEGEQGSGGSDISQAQGAAKKEENKNKANKAVKKAAKSETDNAPDKQSAKKT